MTLILPKKLRCKALKGTNYFTKNWRDVNILTSKKIFFCRCSETIKVVNRKRVLIE